jgi:hypothetical protein
VQGTPAERLKPSKNTVGKERKTPSATMENTAIKLAHAKRQLGNLPTGQQEACYHEGSPLTWHTGESRRPNISNPPLTLGTSVVRLTRNQILNVHQSFH